jgi:HEAT repeat protein
LTFERREEIIHSNTDVQRLRLFVLLSGSHPEGLTILSQTVSHIDNSVRLASVVAIGRFQSPNVSMLLPLLSDRDEAIRRSIIVYLGELRDMRYSQYIIDRLKDDDAGVRYAATVALSSLKPDDSNSMDELTKALGDAEAKVRYGACLALARIAPQQESIRQAVFLTLNDVDPEVRQGAVRAIASIFPHSTLSLLKLVDVLNDTDIIVRWYAKQALVARLPLAHERAKVIEELLAMSRCSSDHVREDAHEVLTTLNYPMLADLTQNLLFPSQSD